MGAFILLYHKAVELLTNNDLCRILELREGRIVCPHCGRVTDQVVLAETIATNLAVYCKRCKNTLQVKIEDGRARARA